MALFPIKRRQVKYYLGKLGMVLLGCLAADLILSGNTILTPDVRYQPEKSFDIQENGVVVVLDIANTGMSSLSNYIIRQSIMDTPCRCMDQLTKCQCLNKQGQHWLFQAYNSTGYVCGDQADFTTLTKCPIDNWFRTSGKDSRPYRQYLIVTMIREPLTRYVSEWLALKQEDTFFKNEPRLFRNESVERQKKGLACYVGKIMSALSLQDFLNCRENGAMNRQTRMLANMTFVNSLGLSGTMVQEAMLASAKVTLQKLPFFGIYNRPNDTQKLLENTLGFRFREYFNLEDSNVQEALLLPAYQQHQILQANRLDTRLFQFALDLFQERAKIVRFSNRNVESTSVKKVENSRRVIYESQFKDERDTMQRGDTILDNEIEESEVDVTDLSQRKDDVTDDDDWRVSSQDRPSQNDQFRLDDDVSFVVNEEDVNKMNKSKDGDDEFDEKIHLFGMDEKNVRLDEKSHDRVPDEDMKSHDHRSDLDTKSHDHNPEIDPKSPDYVLDLEDVSLFLTRLEGLKQQQKQQHEKQQQKLEQLSQQINRFQSFVPLSPTSKPLPIGQQFDRSDSFQKVSHVHSARENKHQYFILDGVQTVTSIPNNDRRSYERGINRMFH